MKSGTSICSWRACVAIATFLAGSTTGYGAVQPYAMTWRVEGFINRRDVVNDVVVDSADNVYVGGKTEEIYSVGDNLPESALVAKYNPAGVREWLSYAYPTRHLDHVLGMTIDSADNLIIVGETYRYQGAEAFVVKFNKSGTRLWERHIGSPDNEFGRNVAVDALDNIYLIGSTTGDLGVGSNGSGYDPFIVKYGPSGNTIWTMQLPDTLGEFANSIALDAQANFFLTGSQGLHDYLAKFDANRNLLWSTFPKYSDNTGVINQVRQSVTDSAGNVFVAGTTNGIYDSSLGFTSYDGVVAKHDADGNIVWQYVLEGPQLTSVRSLTLDGDGNIYIVGSTAETLASSRFGDANPFWAKFGPAGNLLWYDEFGTSESDGANGIAVDSQGTVYVSGTVARNYGSYYQGDVDMFLARFDAIPEPTAIVGIVCGLLVGLSVHRGRGRGRVNS